MTDITFQASSFPHPEAEEFITSIPWGTSGNLQYQLVHPPNTAFVPSGHVLYLARNSDGRLVGTYLVSPQPTGELRSLLAVHPDYQGTGVGPAFVEHVRRLHADRHDHLLGTIDETNARSLIISQRYYQEAGRLDAITFSRRRPKPSTRVRRAGFDSLQTNFSRPQWLPTGTDGNVYELVQDGTPIAGVLIEPHTWRLLSLGNPVIDLALPLLTRFLGVTKDNYRYGFLHFWWGPPELYNELWEHALADSELTSALAVGLEGSREWNEITSQLRKGLIGSIVGSNYMVVTSTRDHLEDYVFTPTNAL